jgi:hypothetical protein
MTKVLRRVVKHYITVLVRTKPMLGNDEDNKLRQRLRADMGIIKRLFDKYEAEAVEQEVKPMVNVIALLDIESGNAMPKFMEGTLFRMFGQHASLKMIKAALQVSPKMGCQCLDRSL